MALSCRAGRQLPLQLLEAKQISRFDRTVSADDPKWTGPAAVHGLLFAAARCLHRRSSIGYRT